jgi:hypothetical protein
MNPLLLPVAGGLTILLLLGLLLHLRRRADRVATEAGPGAAFEDGAVDDTDIVPMPAHDDQPAAGGTDELTGHGDEPVDEEVTEVAPEPVHTPELLADSEPVESWDADVPPGPEPVNVRYLRAQVRTLQETLEQVQDTPEPAVAGSGEATFRRQVTAALRGLGERTREDESPERTLARVVAAIERLDAPDEVARPALPTVKFDLSGAQMSLAGPQTVAAPAALGRAPAPAAAAPDARGAATVTTPLASALAAGAPDEHLDHRASPSHDRVSHLDPFAEDEQVLPPPPEPDVVLPVPPPASHRDERHRRFGRRRGA